jgi:hypothetical protein
LYFRKYRNNLTQYIIYNCCITPDKKKRGRVNLTENEILGLLKELARVELYLKNG